MLTHILTVRVVVFFEAGALMLGISSYSHRLLLRFLAFRTGKFTKPKKKKTGSSFRATYFPGKRETSKGFIFCLDEKRRKTTQKDEEEEEERGAKSENRKSSETESMRDRRFIFSGISQPFFLNL